MGENACFIFPSPERYLLEHRLAFTRTVFDVFLGISTNSSFLWAGIFRIPILRVSSCCSEGIVSSVPCIFQLRSCEVKIAFVCSSFEPRESTLTTTPVCVRAETLARGPSTRVLAGVFHGIS